MKFSLLTAAGVLSAISQAAAVTIVTPWASSTWTSGGHGNITWTSTTADAALKCDIYLLNGNFTNANLVAQITDPATPVPCSANSFDIYPLNDFAAGQYWVRIGQAATNTWDYSGVFSFVGKGTVGPASVANGSTVAAPSGVVSSNSSVPVTALPSGVSTVTGAKTNASSAISGASATPTASKSGAESAMSINSAAVALGAIAAIAFSL